MTGRKLGRLPTRHDPRTLKLASYTAPLPAIPDMKNWGVVSGDWGMMRNDELGDCTIAAAGHMVLLDTAARGTPVRIEDCEIVRAYAAVSGYTPGDPSTDNGAVELNVLNYWRQLGIGGHKILGYAAVPLNNRLALRQAIYLFGAVYAGVELPRTAQDQDVWNVDPDGGEDSAPGSWGGHAVPLVGYDTHALACITWGEPKWLTDDWWAKYGSEAYVVISEDWAPPGGVAPNSFNMDQLKADLAAITAGA